MLKENNPTVDEVLDEELENVSGGANEDTKKYTEMHCNNCGYETYWDGPQYVGCTYKCEFCDQRTLTGVRAV